MKPAKLLSQISCDLAELQIKARDEDKAITYLNDAVQQDPANNKVFALYVYL